MIVEKTAKDLKPALVDPKVKVVKDPYYLIKGEEAEIFVVSSGLNGTEYNKTVGFFSSFPGVTIYQCLFGQGVLLLQRNDEGEAKEFKVVTLSSGRQVGVPAGWASVLVNVGKNFLVVLRNGNLDEKYLDEKPILDKQGLAYYVVEKKGEIAFEQNRNYRVHPQITTE